MAQDKAYLVNIHKYSFKSGIPAEIIGVVWVTPEGLEPRLCYHVKWSDAVEDFIAVKDDGNYKIISFSDILSGDIPMIKY